MKLYETLQESFWTFQFGSIAINILHKVFSNNQPFSSYWEKNFYKKQWFHLSFDVQSESLSSVCPISGGKFKGMFSATASQSVLFSNQRWLCCWYTAVLKMAKVTYYSLELNRLYSPWASNSFLCILHRHSCLSRNVAFLHILHSVCLRTNIQFSAPSLSSLPYNIVQGQCGVVEITWVIWSKADLG